MHEDILKKDIVYSLLRSRIVSGEYPAGYKFPGEAEFAKELGVGRVTLRSAIEKLEKTGMASRLNGRGTFVADTKENKRGVKHFLVVTYEASIEHPANYILPAFERACGQSGSTVERLPFNVLRALPEERAVKALSKEDYDGILLTGSHYLGDEKELVILKQLGKPILLPHARSSDAITSGCAVMHPDNRSAWLDAIRYLKEKGHRNILTLVSEGEDGKPFLRDLSMTDYFNFLASEQLSPDPALAPAVRFKSPGLTKTLADILAAEKDVTAIMCFSDFYAMSVYESLAALSVKIPGDIAVMGYCGYPGGNMMAPPLSTVDLDYEGIGKTAFNMLCGAEKWFGKSGQAIISPHKLVKRESA